MLGGKSCDMFVELDPIPQPFYRAGDAVSGQVSLAVLASSMTVKDIQVKLRCDEYSAVAADDNSKQAMVEKREAKHAREVARRRRKGHGSGAKDTFTAPRPSAAIDHQRHIELTTSVFDSSGGRQSLPRGTHKFDFKIVLPDSVNLLPPHSPVPTRNGLKVGVEWTVKAVAHRSGHLKSSVRATAEIPVHPMPQNAELGDLSRRAELSGQKFLGRSKGWSYFGSILGIMSVDISAPSGHRGGERQLIVRLGYPNLGIPQGPIKPNFSLTLEVPNGSVTVTAINVYLVQRCLASVHKKRQLNDSYKNMFVLGQARAVRNITSKPQDLSDLVSDFAVKDVFAAPFASNFITISYELRIEVECASHKENKPEFVVLEVPVNLLSPGVCWPSKSTGNFDAIAHAPTPVRKNSSESESCDSSEQPDDGAGPPSYDDLVNSSNTRVLDEDTYNDLKR